MSSNIHSPVPQAVGRPSSGGRLRRGLLAAAVFAATLTCGAGVHGAASSAYPAAASAQPAAANAVAVSAKSAAAPAPKSTDITVAVNGAGAVYVNRAGTSLQFWVANTGDNTIVRKASVTVDPTVANTVFVELGDNVTGLFYADNLRAAGDQFRISFRGQLPQGGAAMPLAAQALAALQDVSLPDDVVTVTPVQVDLMTLLDNQRAIYQRVQEIGPLQEDQVALFRLLAEQEMADAYTTQIHEGATGAAFLSEGEATVQTLHDQFIARVTHDVATAQAAADEILAKGRTQIDRFAGPVTDCINGQIIRINSRLKSLEGRLVSWPDDESYNQQIEDEIAATEAALENNEAMLMSCVDTQGLDDYEPTVAVDENGADYEVIANAAQAFVDDLEPRVEAWRLALEAAGAAKAARIEDSALAANTLAAQDYFSAWVSPVYSDESDTPVVPVLPGARNKQADADTPEAEAMAKAKAEAKALAQAKGMEVLCDDETWNLEFALGSLNVVIGTPWNDRIVTGEGNDVIVSFSGNDCIESHAGYDFVLAGRGNDTVYAGEDHDFVLGGRGDDEIHGGSGHTYTITIDGVEVEFDLGNLLIGQSGNDRIFGGEVDADRGADGAVDDHGYMDFIFGDALLFGQPAGNDFIDGEMGIDFLFGNDGDDQIVNIEPGVIGIAGLDVSFGSWFFGGNGNDVIVGSNTDVAGTLPLLGDFIFGNAGDDVIAANRGMDFVFGADGNDRIDGGAGMDFAFGSGGNDSVVGNDGLDLVTGNDGNDIVRGSAGFDLVFGGDGDDTLSGDDGMDLVFGRSGADTISGGNGIDLLLGGRDNDVIDGNDGTDLAFGGDGEDRINGNDGIDLLLGQAQSDTIRGGSGTDVIIGGGNTEKKDEFLYGEAGIDLVFGSAGNDVIEGGADLDLLFGNRGDDRIDGNDGTDLVFGGDGYDTMNGNAGLDVLFGGGGRDTLDGGADTDVIFGGTDCDAIAGGDGADLIFGGDGKDKINGGDSLDIVFGGKGQDHIQGSGSPDFLFGGDDHDYIDGGDAFDVILGQSGDDYIVGGVSLDVLLGGSGNDYIGGGPDADFVFGGADNDVLDGGDGSDLLFAGGGDDKINSGSGTDFSFGNAGNDHLRAVEGTNFAFGNKGDDRVDGYQSSGSDNRDFLFGNSDNDMITGNQSSQKDLRMGGGGSDTKVWNQTYVPASVFNVSWAGNLVCQ